MVWRRKLARLRTEVQGWPDLILMGRIALLALLLPGLLRHLSLPALMRMLTPAPSRHRSGAVEPDRIVRLTDLVLGRMPLVRTPCLIRSLILYRLLHVAGMPVRVHFGVRHAGGQLAGHGWLTYQGQPVYEPAGREAFTEMYVYPLHASLLARVEEEEQPLCAWPG